MSRLFSKTIGVVVVDEGNIQNGDMAAHKPELLPGRVGGGGK